MVYSRKNGNLNGDSRPNQRPKLFARERVRCTKRRDPRDRHWPQVSLRHVRVRVRSRHSSVRTVAEYDPAGRQSLNRGSINSVAQNLYREAVAGERAPRHCGRHLVAPINRCAQAPAGIPGPCQSPAMPNRRCWIHGGRSPGAPKAITSTTIAWSWPGHRSDPEPPLARVSPRPLAAAFRCRRRSTKPACS